MKKKIHYSNSEIEEIVKRSQSGVNLSEHWYNVMVNLCEQAVQEEPVIKKNQFFTNFDLENIQHNAQDLFDTQTDFNKVNFNTSWLNVVEKLCEQAKIDTAPKKEKPANAKTYTIEVFSDIGHQYNIKRTNDGFDAYQLLGILQMTIDDIKEQIKGNIKPNIVRNFIEHDNKGKNNRSFMKCDVCGTEWFGNTCCPKCHPHQ